MGKNNSVWNTEAFRMSGLGEKLPIIGKVKYIKNCIKWSWQIITRGYCDRDVWNMCFYLQTLLPDMLQTLKDKRVGSPGSLGENYVNKDGIVVNDKCHEEWDNILTEMIYLWRETSENTCSRKNHYEEEFNKSSDEFHKKYGLFGEKLQTEEEKQNGRHVLHFMSEVLEYSEISEKYRSEEKQLMNYYEQSKDKACDMLKKYFFDLVD